MTEIMWLMYFADISGSVGVVCCIALIVSSLVYGFSSVVVAVEKDVPAASRVVKVWARNFIVFAIVGVLTPSKQTIYAIVAIKSGDEIVKTKLGDKALKALDVVLDRVIDGEKK